MRIENLEILQSIIESGSISQAARKHHITQPAVSSQIHALEVEHEIELFMRNPGQKKPLILTEAGEVFYEYAKKILGLYQDMGMAINNINSTFNEFTLGTSPTVGTYIAPFIVESLRRCYPQVPVSLKMCLANSLLPKLRQKEYDMIISCSPPNDDDIIANYFLCDELVLIASENYPIKDTITLKQLLKLPLALREDNTTTRRILSTNLMKHGIKIKDLNVVMQAFGTEAVKQAVSTGMVLGFVAKSSITGHNLNNMYRIIQIKGLDLSRHLYLIYMSNRPFTTSMKFFCKFLSSKQWQ